MITLYEHDLETAIADLDNVIVDNDIQIEKVINNIDILSLTTRIEEFKTDKIDKKNAIKVDNQFYRINDITKSHRTNVPTLKIECEHIMYDLNEESIRELKIVDKDNREVLELLLKDTDFKVGQVDQTINHNLIYSDVSVRSALIDFANTNNLEIIFDNYVVSLVKTIGKSAGFAVEFGKNVLGIEKIYESGSQPGYEIDLVELSNTEEYKQLKLEQFESVDVGDQIIITDRAIRISDERQTVIGITYNPLERVNTKLQIARKIKNFAETMARNELETEKEIKEIQSNVESLSDINTGTSVGLQKRIEKLELNNAYLLDIINQGVSKKFEDYGMIFSNGVLTETIEPTMEVIIVKDIKEEYEWFDTNRITWTQHIDSLEDNKRVEFIATEFVAPTDKYTHYKGVSYSDGNIDEYKVEEVFLT